MFTPFEELNVLLSDFTATVREILAETFVGAYVQGSFALGAGDMNSDCDFIVAATVPPSGAAESELRRLHNEIPTRAGFWPKHLEGSYADVATLRGVGGLGTPWLYCDHGHRELIWDTHCNKLHARWILRHAGVVLAGPSPVQLVDPIDPEALREEARTAMTTLMADLKTWLPLDVAWSQRYIVATYCRIFYTLNTAEVASKKGVLEWAREHLQPRWSPLLTQVIGDRERGWDPDERPRPGSLQAAYDFAAHVEALCGL